MNHTSGPWTVETNNAYQTSWLIMDARGNRLAQVANWQDKCRNVDGEANAKLMASAPDLLAAMKHIHDTLKHIAECASIPERDAEELAVYVSGFLPNDKVSHSRELP